MTLCDDIREARLLGGRDQERVEAHLAVCPACRDEAGTVTALRSVLATGRALAPPAALAARVRSAAAPLLARNARAATWRTVGRAVGAAMLPLPIVLLIDGYLVRAIYDTLSAVLPDALSLYFVLNYSVLLALLLTVAYGAIPLLAERQARLRREESYG